MALETATTINQLDAANPAGPDRLAQGDDHIRLIKLALKNTFPNISGPMTLTQAFLNGLATGAAFVPFGTIHLWYGAITAIPAGYARCDGTAVARSDGSGNITTPDMRGRVPVGASSDATVGVLFGQDTFTVTSALGGSHSHLGVTDQAGSHTHSMTVDGTALTLAQLPAHAHGIGIADDNLGAQRYLHGTKSIPSGLRPIQDSASGSSDIEGLTESLGSGAAHTHSGSTDAAGLHAHNVQTDIVPGHSHAVTVPVVQASIALHYIMKV